MKHLLAIVMLCYSTSLMAQSKLLSDKDMEWVNTIKEHVSINGYAHAGYAYSDTNGKTKSDFNLKRTLLWAKVKVTDRLTALFMHDFNSEVQEYWADYRVTNNDALHVKFGQFKNSLSIENPLSPVYLELVDVCSQSVTCYSGCYDPLYGLNYGRDIGLEIYGNLFDNHIRYELEVMNGQGINTRDGNSDKDVIARVEYKPIKELRLVVSGQKGRGHAVGTAAWNPDIKEGDNYRRDRITAGFEWKSGQYAPGPHKEARPISIRAEYLAGKDGKVDSQGAYATTTIPVYKGIDIVGSIDYFDRNTDMDYRQTQATAGVQYWFYKKCRLQLQYTRTWSEYQKDYNWLQAQLQLAF